MSYMRFSTSETPSGQFVLARLHAGPSREETRYAGTLTLPAETWEQFLDCLVHGAAEMGYDDERLRVFFGPDEDVG